MTSSLLLVLLTYPSSTAGAALPAAVALAKHVGARITGLGVEVDIPDLNNALAEAILHIRDDIKTIKKRSHRESERLLSKLSELCSNTGVVMERQKIRAAPAFMGSAIASFARFYDFGSVPLALGDVAACGIAETLIFDSGRPVILLPEGTSVGRDLDTVVVATDFGRSAARALFDALPFLKRAARVHIISAVDEKDMSKGNREALLGYLDNQGISADLIEVDSSGKPVGEVLQEYAVGIGAGILVMGAFGHSRLREFVLGGATKTVLYAPRLPILMSH